MKELTIEQKAKAYDEAKARMSRAYNDNRCSIGFMNEIFPELKESEDERIKEWLINLAKGHIEWLEDRIREQLSNGQVYGGELVKAKNSLAWLERQKTSEEALQYLEENHSPSEMSDFQAAMNIAVAKAYDKGYNDALEKQGEQKPTDNVEPKFKAGDWLVHKDLVGVTCCITQIHAPHYYLTNNNSFIKFGDEDNYRPWTIQDAKDGDVLYYISDYNTEYILMYKGINRYNNIDSYFRYNSIYGFAINIPSVLSANSDNITPATKEQRDLLFQKMHDAGYEWDAEKKELKKIEQILANSAKTCKDEKETTWGEEDKRMFDYALDMIEWYSVVDKSKSKRVSDWLKSLRPQNTWKPSNEQMEFVWKYAEQNNYDGKVFTRLYNDLKKLK